jgi:fucose permease
VDGLLVLLVIFAIAEITEGGVDTWGVLYLRTHLAAGVLLGAGAYVAGQGIAALTRGAGAPAIGRLSPRRALIVGGLVAGAGMLVESGSSYATIAAIGLACGAGGASLFWPIVMSDVVVRATQPVAATGAFTAAGYVGLVAGAPLIGWISDAWGLDRGLLVLASFAFLVAALSLLRRERSWRANNGSGEP